MPYFYNLEELDNFIQEGSSLLETLRHVSIYFEKTHPVNGRVDVLEKYPLIVDEGIKRYISEWYDSYQDKLSALPRKHTCTCNSDV